SAPLPRANSVVRVPWHEGHRRGFHHAAVLADDASLAAFLVLDHHGPLQHRPHPYLLAVNDRAEAAADFVVGGWNDAGQRDEFNDLAHMVASLGLGGGGD